MRLTLRVSELDMFGRRCVDVVGGREIDHIKWTVQQQYGVFGCGAERCGQWGCIRNPVRHPARVLGLSFVSSHN